MPAGHSNFLLIPPHQETSVEEQNSIDRRLRVLCFGCSPLPNLGTQKSALAPLVEFLNLPSKKQKSHNVALVVEPGKAQEFLAGRDPNRGTF